MARKTKAQELLEDLAPTVEEIDFETFLEQIAPQASVIDVFRVGRDGATARIDRIDLNALMHDPYGFVYDSYGAGKFELQFKGSDGRYRGGKRILVDDKKPPAAPGQAASTPAGGDIWEKMFLAQSQQLTAILSAMKPASGPDVGAMLTGMAAVMATLKPAAAPDAGAMLQAVATVFATLRGPQSDQDWLDRAGKIIEMAKNLTPGDGGGDSWAGVARDVGKVVMDKLAPPAGTVPAPAGVIAAPGVPAILPAPAASVEVLASSAPPMQAGGQNVMDWIKVCLAYLKEKAKLAKDPDFYVEWLFENEEEPQCAAVVRSIEEGATFEQLLAFDPEIGQNPAYYHFLKRVYDGVQTELQKSMDRTRPGGDTADPNGYAPVGAGGGPLAGGEGDGRPVS